MVPASGDSRRDSCASREATLPTRRPAPTVAATIAAARRKQTEMITIWLSLFAQRFGGAIFHEADRVFNSGLYISSCSILEPALWRAPGCAGLQGVLAGLRVARGC